MIAGSRHKIWVASQVQATSTNNFFRLKLRDALLIVVLSSLVMILNYRNFPGKYLTIWNFTEYSTSQSISTYFNWEEITNQSRIFENENLFKEFSGKNI